MSSSNVSGESLPYNPSNTLIHEPAVGALLSAYGGVSADIHDINIYRKAMVHRSYCTRKNENFVNGNMQCPDDCLPLQEESNERLEFLGDAVINLIVASYLFERYPDENEGFLTKLRTKLVNGSMLAHLCRLVKLQKYIIVSKQIEDAGGRNSDKILEDAFEAFIGAMYLDRKDKGYVCVEQWLVGLIESHLDFSTLIHQQCNYKDMLLKYFQHNFSSLPKFLEIHVDNHGKQYKVCVRDKNDLVVATGTGANKKAAENDAARNALVYYGQTV